MVTRPRRRAEPHDYLVLQGANLAPDGPSADEAGEEVPLELIALPRWKRAMDVVLASLALLALAPLFVVVAAVVRLDSRGPAFFRQARVGAGGRPFTCFKFRSMYVDAEARLEFLAHLNEATGHVFKIRDDPRRTRVGKILRKTSVDELPQFWNVVRGDMTLVGPRPPLPAEVEHYGPNDKARLRGVPGITGPWQVSAREHHDFEEMLDLDLEYLENISFMNDCRILLATVPAVLRARGSH